MSFTLAADIDVVSLDKLYKNLRHSNIMRQKRKPHNYLSFSWFDIIKHENHDRILESSIYNLRFVFLFSCFALPVWNLIHWCWRIYLAESRLMGLTYNIFRRRSLAYADIPLGRVIYSKVIYFNCCCGKGAWPVISSYINTPILQQTILLL